MVPESRPQALPVQSGFLAEKDSVCVCVFFVLARFNGNPVEAEFAESFEGPWPRLLAGSEALPDAFAQTSSLIKLKGWSR